MKNILHKLIIPEIPVGMNGNNGLLRMRVKQRIRYVQDWRYWIRSAIPYPPEKCGREIRLVKIHQIRKQLFKDDDNLESSCKPILDALKTWGFIFEDSREWIRKEITQDIRRGREVQTIITIEPF